MQINDQPIKQNVQQSVSKNNRLFYLDSLKYIFCLMIFWTHFTGVFWTMCEVKPDLRPELQLLFHPPLSILVDSNLALYGFCILSGFLAVHKKFKNLNELLWQLLARYIRFVIPFFFINLLAFIIYYTIGFPTQISSQLLHNTWVGTYYNHAPTVTELIKSSLTMSGDLNGPLWMMKYIFGGTCLIYIYNYIRELLCHVDVKEAVQRLNDGSRQSNVIIYVFDIICLLLMIVTLMYLPEPNFFHLLLVLSGVILLHADNFIKAHKRNEILFFLMALLPVFLDAGGLNKIIFPFIRDHIPVIAPAFIWNTYWVMGFSFFLILGVMNCTTLQNILNTRALRSLAPTNFSVYLIHFPLITCFSLKLYLLMVNRISYSKEFIIITFATFIALFILSYVYDQTIGKLQNKLIKVLTSLHKH